MKLCVASIVQVARYAIVNKEDGTKYSADPAAIARIALPLHKRIKSTICNALQTAPDGSVDWETQVFEPVIAGFRIKERLNTSIADAEYLVLISAVIMLAYEILLLPAVGEELSTSGFLVRTCHEYLCEPTVSCKLIAQLESERDRLERAEANIEVLRAMWKLLGLMPDKITRSYVWKDKMPDLRRQADLGNMEAVDKLPNPDRDSLASLTTFPRDLHIQVYLKTHFSWDFDFVDSIAKSDGILIIKTCIGINLRVEPGFTVSDVSGIFDTVTIARGQGCDTSLAGTIVVPPGYSFHGTEVECVSEMAGNQAQTMIETRRAVLNVSNGRYVVRRRNCHTSVLVESIEI
jgi:hypothetical protein